MNRVTFRWILVLGLILAIRPSTQAQSAAAPIVPPAWPVSSAPARFTIDLFKPGPFLISGVDLFLPDPKWVTMPIRVFTDTGIAVGSDVIWAPPGGPVLLFFDSSSGAKRYQVYVGSNWPRLHLPDGKAGVWLEVREGDGKIIQHLPEMLQAWNQSPKVLGRAILPGIWLGGNLFGPQVNLLEHFQGWFEASAPEHLELATISSYASFVLVDGKEVVEWPGAHDRWYGSQGPPQGAVDLQAGLHVVDYYNAYVASDPGIPVTSTLAEKIGPDDSWHMLTPDNNFIRPHGVSLLVSYDLQASSPGSSALAAAPALAMIWVNNPEQSMIETNVADIGFISMQLRSFVPTTGTQTLNWTFDDGSTAQGQSVNHLFPRPGMRTVQLTLKDGDRQLASLTQTISVHPMWQFSNLRPGLLDAHEADIMSRDPSTLSASDLVSCVTIFSAFEKTDDLLKFLPALCAKMSQINEPDLTYLNDAAMSLERIDRDHLAAEIQLYRALVDRCSQANPSPQLIAIGSQCRLGLAQLVLKTTDHTDEVKSLIDAINAPSLPGNEHRALKILQADLTLATGDIAGAKKQYQNLTGDPSGADARSSIRRTAKIGQARAFLDRKDFDAAQDALSEAVRHSPVDKLAPDWALTQLRLYQERNQPDVAYLLARRLLPVITESGRSELLFRLTGLALAQGDKDLAHKSLSELLLKHPYSQEAAEAKEKWPGQE